MERNNTGKTATELPGKSKSSELSRVLGLHQGERHIIAIQNFPDPDAISSAFAHKLICQKYEIEVDTVYDGKVSHQQNIALIKILDIELVRYSENLDLAQYQGSVFLDNQGTTTSLVNKLEQAGVRPVIIVDHHERQNILTPEFTDIRRIGATATIYANYIREGLLELSKTDRNHMKCATALMHGIRSETGELIRAKEEDLLAAAFLANYHDANLHAEIVNQARSKKVMDIIHEALGNRVIKDNYSVSGIGYLRMEDRDAIPQAADFLLTEENVHTAIVYGIVLTDKNEEILSGSFRTSKITLDPDDFIKDAFGKNDIGKYFGGGKQEAGGFEVPIGFLSGVATKEFEELKWQVYDLQVKQKIFNKIGVTEKSKD
jgi:nanoRNase/pAp phosphatase (c-di-AMP/oligoRNAs hydrolase)